MCTAISYGRFFGRNLDWTENFGEKVVITPRKFPFKFRQTPEIKEHFAIIGTAVCENNYPLYFDAANEKGLAMAGLNFPDNAVYNPICESFDNIAPFEFIPWILSQCENVTSAKRLLNRINICNIPFSDDMPNTPLHWLIADKDNCITVEQTKRGLSVFENKTLTLTNNPPFDIQLFYLSNFLNLTPEEPENRFSDKIDLIPASRGMGALFLPGDFSSQSRFVKAAFTLLNSPKDGGISQFFHILSSVEQICGSVKINGQNEKTLYSSCIDTAEGIYYYKTCENSRINAVCMQGENLDGNALISYPYLNEQDINYQNNTVF